MRRISDAEHLQWNARQPHVSFLQTPSWGKVKAGWQSQSIGWFDGDQIIGAGLLLLRKVPRVRRYLAYLPEGPDLDWSRAHEGLDALATYCRDLGAFQIKIGPHVWVHRWDSATLKDAIAANFNGRINEIAPTSSSAAGALLTAQLQADGWQQDGSGGGFGDYQPRFVFQLNVRGKSDDELLADFNQQWRRNIRKAQAAGVTVRLGESADLAKFHDCYAETAARDKFAPRPLSYFESMWRHMNAEDPSRLKLFVAQHPDHEGFIAATLMVTVGDHAWYSYGASTTAARELRPSNAIQWAMIRHCRDGGASTYDMRGISDNLNPEGHLFGLVQFKLGTGGYAQEYVGEWDLVLSRIWATAMRLYMARR